MSRDYDYYYAPRTINARTYLQSEVPPSSSSKANEAKVGTTVSGEIFVGARFQNNLLANKKLYKELGFFKEMKIRVPGSPAESKPSALILFSQSDGQRLNVYKIYSLTLIPRTPSIILASYGSKYVTRVPVSSQKSDGEIAKVLYNFIFEFGVSSAPLRYVVQDNSIMLVRGKKSAAKLGIPAA